MTLILLIGVLPCILLILYIYHLDKVEKEPLGLLIKLFFFGCLTTIGAALLETVGEGILNAIYPYPKSLTYNLIMYFIIVGISEEGLKHFALRKGTWYHPAFDYRFDAVVYAAVVSLGFAAAENVKYILGFGLSVAPIRAVTAIPLHCIVGVFMGHYYGQARFYDRRGRYAISSFYMFLSLFVPVLLHGFYDFCASGNSRSLSALFVLFVILLDIVALISVNRYAKNDKHI